MKRILSAGLAVIVLVSTCALSACTSKETSGTRTSHEVSGTSANMTTTQTETTEEQKGVAVIRMDSFDGGGPEYEAKIEDESIVSVSVRREYRDPDHENLNGAGFDYVFTFTGIKEGETTVVISGSSPIVEPTEDHYKITVAADLSVKIQNIPETDPTE